MLTPSGGRDKWSDDLDTVKGRCYPVPLVPAGSTRYVFLKVNDSFTKSGVIVRISCEFCPNFMLILSVSIANVVHIKIESCPPFMRPLSASE